MEYLDLDHDTVMGYLQEDDCRFFGELRGADKMADFMYNAGFISNKVTMDNLKYDNVESN